MIYGGWARPFSPRDGQWVPAAKVHYFVDSVSLCRKWEYTGESTADPPSSPPACKACTMLLEIAQQKSNA